MPTITYTNNEVAVPVLNFTGR